MIPNFGLLLVARDGDRDRHGFSPGRAEKTMFFGLAAACCLDAPVDVTKLR
jgi:hypothetical protein